MLNVIIIIIIKHIVLHVYMYTVLYIFSNISLHQYPTLVKATCLSDFENFILIYTSFNYLSLVLNHTLRYVPPAFYILNDKLERDFQISKYHLISQRKY